MLSLSLSFSRFHSLNLRPHLGHLATNLAYRHQSEQTSVSMYSKLRFFSETYAINGGELGVIVDQLILHRVLHCQGMDFAPGILALLQFLKNKLHESTG